MAGYILRGGQQNISLPADALDKLLQSGQGDAALLYLALQRFGRGVTPEELEKAPHHGGVGHPVPYPGRRLDGGGADAVAVAGGAVRL